MAAHTSEINIKVGLDENKIPEKLSWSAPDGGVNNQESKAVLLSVWDHKSQEALRIDLWTKDMPVDDMKRFYIDCLGGMAQNILNATGDEFIAHETNALAEKLVKHVKKTS